MDNDNPKGRLYLSATPIGNLEDMTYRSVRLLAEADLIAAEDTRHTRKLLSHYDIHTPLVSYHEHNKFEQGPQLVDYMLQGHTLVCVSDAGLPGIADPGSHLAQLAIAAGIPVSPLPGANAALSALICSGLDTTVFTFVGFLPKTSKKSRETLELVKTHRETLIFYEAPHHLKATLKELVTVLGPDRPACAARELTKKFEEFNRSTLGELADYYSINEPRGEFVIVVAGCSEDELAGVAEKQSKETASDNPVELVQQLQEQGLDKKSAMREAAKRLGMSRRDVYSALLEYENKE